MISLLIADDHPVIIDSIMIILDQSDDILFAGEFNSGHTLLDYLKMQPADVVLLNINMHEMN